MSTKSPRNKLDPITLNNVLQPQTNRLGQIIRKAKQIKYLQALLSAHLPEPISQHIQVMNIEKRILSIRFTNSSLASLARMHIGTMLDIIAKQSKGISIDQIKIKVRPH